MSSAGVCETKGWMLNIKRVLEFRQVRIRTTVHLQPPMSRSKVKRNAASTSRLQVLSHPLRSLGVCSLEKEIPGPNSRFSHLPSGLTSSGPMSLARLTISPSTPRTSRLPPPHHRHQSLPAGADTVRDMSSVTSRQLTFIDLLQIHELIFTPSKPLVRTHV